MKRTILFTAMFALISSAYSTVYTTDGVDSWDVNGAPPAGWQSGNTINVNHSITNMTAYSLMFNGTVDVNINSGGVWKIASVVHNLTTSTLTVKSGGRFELTTTLAWTSNTLDVQAGGLLRTNGATSAASGTMTVNGVFFIDGSWTNDVAIAGSGIINYTGTKSGTGSFTGGTESLPVELIAFDGEKTSFGTQLTWATASETESDHFKILKSIDGIEFKEIGSVPAAGFSEGIIEYFFIDPESSGGNIYFQLLEEDFDGTQQPSEIIKVYNENPFGTIVSSYPNPTTDNINISFFSEESQSYELKMIDINGRVAYKGIVLGQEGRNKATLDVVSFTKGQYIIQLSNSEKVISSVNFIKK